MHNETGDYAIEEAGDRAGDADSSCKMTKRMTPAGPRMDVAGDTEVELSAAAIRLHVPSENTPRCRSRDAREGKKKLTK